MTITTTTNELLQDPERTPCEVWSRVMGYHRPINYWNVGKQAEWAERVSFKLNTLVTSIPPKQTVSGDN